MITICPIKKKPKRFGKEIWGNPMERNSIASWNELTQSVINRYFMKYFVITTVMVKNK